MVMGILSDRHIIDVSYYERLVSIIGNGIYCDERFGDSVYYEFTEDFSDCDAVIEQFTSAVPDPTMWTDLVNASIVDEKLHITNSGINGEITTVDFFNNDFDIKVDLDIDGDYDDYGWYCYLEAYVGTNKLRVGRKYHYAGPGQVLLVRLTLVAVKVFWIIMILLILLG
jgi:hypothetical protein